MKFINKTILPVIIALSMIGCANSNSRALSALNAEQQNKEYIIVMKHLDGPRYYECEVLNVVDGDTIDVRFKIWADITLEKRVRFEDFDTWEMKGEQKEKGIKAKDHLIKLLKTGKVYLKTSGKTGSFGRTLGIISILSNDGMMDIKSEMIENGHIKIK